MLPSSRVVVGDQATRDNVLRLLSESRWVHFACHASSPVEDPSAGHLVLHDGPLSVLDIARQHSAGGQLAYLSACSTARGGRTLVDECIHISSAFQLAGYQHVVATLWPVHDDVSAHMAEEIYAALVLGSRPKDPAHAVHAAVRSARDRFGGKSPVHWASHIHTGP